MLEGSSTSRLAAVRGYASHVAGCRLGQVTAVARFDQGNRHDVYKVSYLAGQGSIEHVVVRVSFGDGQVEREQAEREAAVLAKIGGTSRPLLAAHSGQQSVLPDELQTHATTGDGFVGRSVGCTVQTCFATRSFSK